MTAMQKLGLVQLFCAATIEANGDMFCIGLKCALLVFGTYLFAIRKPKPWEVE